MTQSRRLRLCRAGPCEGLSASPDPRPWLSSRTGIPAFANSHWEKTMRRSRYWTTLPGLLLVFAALSGAIGCSQGSADKSKNASATQAKAVETQASPAARLRLQPQAQIAAQLGSPSATTSIPGNQLPPPDPKFGGAINLKASESKPWWSPRVVPPKGRPTCS